MKKQWQFGLESGLTIRSDEGLTLETSALESLYGGQFTFINPVDKTKLSCYTPHQCSTTVSLETYPSNNNQALGHEVHAQPC